MKELLPIKLKKPWTDAYKKYRWGFGIEGFCVDYHLIEIAEMCGKDLVFVIQCRKKKYVIDPQEAKSVAKIHRSVFTRHSDRKPVAVIPVTACEVV